MNSQLSKDQQALVDYLGLNDFNLSGGNQLNFNCPFCDDHRKKMYVSPKGKFICFLCETRGNSIVSFISQLDKISYQEATSALKDYGLDHQVSYKQPGSTLLGSLIRIKGQQKVAKPKLMEMIPLPTNCYLLKEHNSTTEPFFQYLYKRGMTDQEIVDYRVCYVVKGLVKTKNKSFYINNQVVFITFDHNGKAIYWNTRSIDSNPYIKSFNGVAVNDHQHTKKNTIFNLNRTDNHIMVVCEGVFNALTCTQGNYVGVATFGKNISDEQVNMIINSRATAVYLFLDNDAKQQTFQLYKRLLNKGLSKPLKIVYNASIDQDANDLGKVKVRELLDQARDVNLANVLNVLGGR